MKKIYLFAWIAAVASWPIASNAVSESDLKSAYCFSYYREKVESSEKNIASIEQKRLLPAETLNEMRQSLQIDKMTLGRLRDYVSSKYPEIPDEFFVARRRALEDNQLAIQCANQCIDEHLRSGGKPNFSRDACLSRCDATVGGAVTRIQRCKSGDWLPY